ncbi:MAG: hypothetical protein IJ040_04220 [Lachnospiraceae bacterium]|nr:hypothetical protein [Lachnospiraceae bacterium]
MVAFIGWSTVGILFVGLGIFAFFAKGPMGFWANAKQFEVSDVKSYNRAVGILWCVFGVIFVALGTPLLMEQNTPYIILSILGAMFEAIAVMVIYTVVIEKKYRKKD